MSVKSNNSEVERLRARINMLEGELNKSKDNFVRASS